VWLNLVELFFRKLTDKTIHRGIFTAAARRNRCRYTVGCEANACATSAGIVIRIG
jgi:hypothetical protein